MQKTISILYTRQSQEESCTLMVNYQIEKQGSVSLISCAVKDENAFRIPQWLHMKKFEIETVYSGGSYSLMYNESNHASDLDTNLFIDQAYGAIMQKEKMKMA